jgi:hypothetical protein
MPNWVVNTLKVIKGDPREIFEFVRSERSVIDFNKLIPMPESIWNSDPEVVTPSGFKVPAWYAWSIDNWGTKWNASEAGYSTRDPERAIWFDTAWDPPVPVFEALAKRFPNHEIVVHSDEDIDHLHVTFTLKEGELTWTKDACRCFAEEENESPLTKAELDVFGIEEAT